MSNVKECERKLKDKQATESVSGLEVRDHHKQLTLCTTRLPYRQGRKLTAVKVYTVNNESQHLLIIGIPKLNLRSELMRLCSKYGNVVRLHVVADYPDQELFTECFHVEYEKIQSARIGKRQMDVKNFYGGVLHVCYAPELESIQQTKHKLEQRRREVEFRIIKNRLDDEVAPKPQPIDENRLEDLRDSVLHKNKNFSNSKKRKYHVISK